MGIASVAADVLHQLRCPNQPHVRSALLPQHHPHRGWRLLHLRGTVRRILEIMISYEWII